VLQDLVIAAAAREHFSALFVTHDLSEAVRVADRLVVLSEGGTGFVTNRRIEGRPGDRSDRAIFDMMEAWSRDPAFSELFDGERKGLP
jgi:NitT/TauT family transport system ATP-binding protein